MALQLPAWPRHPGPATLLILWGIQLVVVGGSSVRGECGGREPGYYAVVASSCRQYVLCTSPANTRGLTFNCPPGTKFQQATRVCHHEAAVRCNNEEEGGQEERNKNSRIVSSRSQITDKKTFIFELNNDVIGPQSPARDDSTRYKREKWTEIKHKANPRKLGGDGAGGGRKDTKTRRKNKLGLKLFPVRKNRKRPFPNKLSFPVKKEDGAPDNRDRVTAKEVIKSVKLEHNDIMNNCSGDTSLLCKSSTPGKEEIRENSKLHSDQITTNQAVTFNEVSKHLEDDTEEEEEEEEDESLSSRPSDDLNVSPGTAAATSPSPTLLIPANLVDDTSKLREDPTAAAAAALRPDPISPDSDNIHNTAQPQPGDGGAGANTTVSRASSSLAPPERSFRTKPLDKLPFARVIAAQKKSAPGRFSPYIPFPELLGNLTRSARTVRMIPIAISSSEADYIRQLLRSQKRKKNVGNKEKDHLRHPRKIKKNDSKVSDEGLKSLEYQVIYKSSSNEPPLSKEKTTTDKSKTTPAPNSEVNTTRISVKPRGPPTGFFNRDKFKQILTSNLRTDRDQSKVSTTTEVNLEFGFNPIKKQSKKAPEKKKAIYFNEKDGYYDEYLDTLQAPAPAEKRSPRPVAGLGPVLSYNSIQSSRRSPKQFPRLSHSSSTVLEKKQDRKSNLDFLGIFDTRKYFFIPPNRRSDTVDGQEDGIFTKLVNFFQK